MATWTANPAITNTTSSATVLNNWRENCQYLYDLLPPIAPPFSRMVRDSDLSSGNTLWTFVHMHRYLHVSITVDEDVDNSISVWYNGTELTLASGATVSPGTYSDVFDLDTEVGGLSLGTEYDCYADVNFNGTGIATVDYIFEFYESTY